MHAIAPAKPTNTSIKLKSAELDRIKAIASADKRSPHFIMKEAIQQYLDKREAEQRWIDAAKRSRETYQATGLHLTHEELGRWVSELKSNPKAPMPVCHK